MAGRSAKSNNWGPNSPETRYEVSGKNREFYTFENAPGLGSYATGGTIIDGGDGYVYHIFTGDGTFTVNNPSAILDNVEYLIVAGGGGTNGTSGGGGGAGGLLFGTLGVSQTPGSYPVTVGAGGPSSPGTPPSIRNGSPSSFTPGIEATGGGGGGMPSTSLTIRAGAPGGSGGGTARGPTTPYIAYGGGGNDPSKIPRQGFPGGDHPPNLAAGATGGGGAGGSGEYGSTPPIRGGRGGAGRIISEFPSDIIKQALPAPLIPSWEPLISTEGFSAGGGGAPNPLGPSRTSSPSNSGYGGIGGGQAGGSGIVCIRYKKDLLLFQRATGGIVEPNTHPEHQGFWRHIFIEPGVFEVTDPSLQYIDYLAVAGGGGGGGGESPIPPNWAGGGGGGGGGFVTSMFSLYNSGSYPWIFGAINVDRKMPISAGQQYPITIGAGGSGGSGTSGGGGSIGGDTTIGSPGPSQIRAIGGGGGAGISSSGDWGGSGGGGNKKNNVVPGISPNGLAVSQSGAGVQNGYQGNAGGSVPGPPAPANNSGGAGGGGAGGVGANRPATGSGGVGALAVLSPSSYGTAGPSPGWRYFSGGGGGAGGNLYPSGGPGGAGGGGAGYPAPADGDGTDGIANTGGGGGGGNGTGSGGNGGSGIVIIQYPE